AGRNPRTRHRPRAPARLPARAGAASRREWKCRMNGRNMNGRIDALRFGLLSTGVAAVIATHLGHLPAWLSLVLLAAIAVRAESRRRGAPTVPVWVRVPLAALLLAWVATSFGNVFGREPGTVLGCGLLALKLLETERVRDARVAVGFAA